MINVLDLGDFAQPVLVCGGAYGNLEALEALQRWADLHGFSDDRIIHTGDAAAYCADAAGASAFIRERGWPSIKGNVEEQLAAGADNCACGFDEASVCNAMSQRWYAYADAKICAEDRIWMASLPSQLAFTMAGRRFLVVHGAVDQTNRFMFESLQHAGFATQLTVAGSDAVIAGHTGIPFTRRLGDQVWHNSGALGLPANDGTRRVWFSTVAPHGDGIRFCHHALVYDHATAANKLRAANLPAGYADALETGLWPSPDILPGTEQRAAGVALNCEDHLWPSELEKAV